MAPLPYFFYSPMRKVLLLSLVLFLFASVHLCNGSVQRKEILGRRGVSELLDEEEEEPVLPKKEATTTTAPKSLSLKNQTKLTKSLAGLSSKNQTKLIKSSNSSAKNQSKPLKPTNSTKTAMPFAEIKKLNSTSKFKKLNSTSKPSNSTKITSLSKKSLDLIKLATPKNKTTKSIKNSQDPDSQKSSSSPHKSPPKKEKTQKPKQPSWVDQEDENDLVSEFRYLPAKFQQTLIPDLEKISSRSKAYISKANEQMTQGFKPYVGNKYAPTIASVVSCAFILIPFFLVSLIFNRIKAYFSLQRLLIFIQIYLSIYFSILCLSSLATGLEPLKFFYATSASTYVCIQVMQTLGYVLYLLLLLMYLVLVFSTDSGLGSKFLGLAQTFVGYAIGLHYYVAVFHRMVLRQPPKTNWKVHGIYAACFLLICLCAGAERRKKAYLEEGGQEGKKS